MLVSNIYRYIGTCIATITCYRTISYIFI